MKTITRKEWADALRSGKYRQGTGALRSYDRKAAIYSHCCLGVACEIAELPYDAHTAQAAKADEGVDVFNTWTTNFKLVPQVVADMLGLKGTATGTFVDMNDEEGKTFEQIADYIEDLPA